MILHKVLPELMTIEEALQSQTDNWKLPSITQLEKLYKTSKDKFGNYGCWSSTKYDDVHYWSLGFHTGNLYINSVTNKNRVCLIKKLW